MKVVKKLSRDEMAEIVANDMESGSYVNLGIGMPTLVSAKLPADKDIILHSENGILGMKAVPEGQASDPDLINASKENVMLIPGSSICDHVVSFTMMRGGHLDLTVLGGFQVAKNGDIANWDTGIEGAIPAVGGAMDLVVGARSVWVMMTHMDREGTSKIVPECTYPLTGVGVVDRIYTDHAIIDLEDGEMVVRGMVDGLTFEELQKITDVPLKLGEDVRKLN